MTQRRRILVTSALPYANGPIHLGYILEAVQTDIWVRFQKLRGHECHYVCADDTHGTPIMLKAQAEGITPERLIEQVNAEHRRDLADMLIGLDNFGSTHSPETKAMCDRMYLTLRGAGHIDRRSVRQAYDDSAKMFLPDRYVKGVCPRVRHGGPVRRFLRKLRLHVHAGGSQESGFRGQRHDAGVARIGALLLSPQRFRGIARSVGKERRGSRKRGAETERVVRAGPEGLGHLQGRALLRLRNSGRPGESTSTSGSMRPSDIWAASRSCARGPP